MRGLLLHKRTRLVYLSKVGVWLFSIGSMRLIACFPGLIRGASKLRSSDDPILTEVRNPTFHEAFNPTKVPLR